VTVPDSTLAGIITAISTLFIAVGGVITALTLLIPILRGTRENKASIGEVHTIVNQQRTDSMRYQRALILALQEKGIDVPKDQSIEPTTEG
jgi:hypothetical protein